MANMSKIGRTHTTIRMEDGVTIVRYHMTDVVKLDPTNMRVALDNGGWFTVTTRTRINQAANQFNMDFGVSQVKGEWFVHIGGVQYPHVNGVWWTL